MSEDLNDFGAHVNQMERDRQAQRAEFERAQMVERERTQQEEYKFMRQRWVSLVQIAGWFAAALASVGIAYVAWLGFRGPSADDLIRQEDRQACLDAGGTYFGSPDVNSDDIVCVMPGASTR